MKKRNKNWSLNLSDVLKEAVDTWECYCKCSICGGQFIEHRLSTNWNFPMPPPVCPTCEGRMIEDG